MLEINYHKRFLKRMVDKVQKQTAAVDQSRKVKRTNPQPTEMLALHRGDQEEKNLKQLITDVFIQHIAKFSKRFLIEISLEI